MDVDAATRAEALKYKLRKEAFVSNLSGSSLSDINLVTLVAPSAILLWTALSKRGVLKEIDPWMKLSIDLLLHVIAILYAFTVYASVSGFLNLVLVVPSILLLLPLYQSDTRGKKEVKSKANRDGESAQGSESKLDLGTLIVRPFLTSYRGAMLIETAIAILAVDFRVFPRRFAKVETWGTSLMDLGVGSFVFSAGLVSARAVIRQTSRQKGNIVARFIQAFRHSIPLLVLGTIRLISVKNLDYAEHVTEYGVHWNFFFTLGFLPPFVELVDSILGFLGSQMSMSALSHSIRYDIAAFTIVATYEIVLNNTDLLSFILISPRTPDSSLLAKNREGVFSFIGYLAIFLSGRSTGIWTCQFQLPKPTKKSDKQLSADEIESTRVKSERWKIIIPQLAIRAAICSGLYLFSTSVYTVNLTVSRRLANLPYVFWIMAYNNAQLALLAIIEAFGPSFVFLGSTKKDGEALPKSAEIASPILQAFNKNGLAVFLIANLGTGLVNLTMNTLDMSDGSAVGVLSIYSTALTVLAVALHSAGINIKL